MNRTTQIIAVAVIAFVVGAGVPTFVIWNPAGWAWADRWAGRAAMEHAEHEHAAEPKQLWTCSMHPQVLQEEPGLCPICQMQLTPVNAGSAAPPAERKILYWRAPMDPNYTSDKPGKSPMGMDLVPVYADEVEGEGGVRVNPNFLQNFAVRTAVAERGTIANEIRTVGVASHNEKSVVSVNTKFAGWIEKAYFNNVGEAVKKGDLLFEIYSPELVSAQQEYLAALGYVAKLEGGAREEAVKRAQSLLEASRERLRAWDVKAEQIDALQSTRQPTRTIRVYAPVSGLIVDKMGDSLEGMRLMPGMTVLKLADHTRLWIEVELYERDLAVVREGTLVRIETRSFPGRTWSGRVSLLDTEIDPRTRTLKAFVEVDNRDLKLRPGMWADATIRPPAASNAVKVPDQAILHSGERAVVIVQLEPGLFEPREVELGAEGGGFQEVRSGVREGETIVVSSQFLIDSESNLKAAIQQLLGER